MLTEQSTVKYLLAILPVLKQVHIPLHLITVLLPFPLATEHRVGWFVFARIVPCEAKERISGPKCRRESRLSNHEHASADVNIQTFSKDRHEASVSEYHQKSSRHMNNEHDEGDYLYY
jgi:hypothetical protein